MRAIELVITCEIGGGAVDGGASEVSIDVSVMGDTIREAASAGEDDSREGLGTADDCTFRQ